MSDPSAHASPAPQSQTQGKRKRPTKDKTPASQETKRQKSQANALLDHGKTNSPVTATTTTTATPAHQKLDIKPRLPAGFKTDTPSKPPKAPLTPAAATAIVAAPTSTPATDRSKRLRRGPTTARRRSTLFLPAEAAATDSASRAAWSTSTPSAGRFIPHDPIFSSDDAYVFASNGREVQVLSVATSLVERTLPGPDHSVTAFALSPTDPETIHIASSSRRVQCWEWISGAVIDEPKERNAHIHALCAAPADNGADDVLYSICHVGGEWHITADDRTLYTSAEPLDYLSLHASYILAASPSAVVVGRRTPPKPESDDPATFTFIEISSPIKVTCLDARTQTLDAPKKKGAPTETLAIAAGNAEGQIMVYEDVFSAAKPSTVALTPRTLHWHREAVASVKWSRDGNYLISGGRETTLVLWQLATGKKQFLPHLTAEIERLTVSPSGAAYAVQLADNSIMVLSTTELKPIANFAGLQAQAALQSTFDKGIQPSAAALHPFHRDQLLLSVPASQATPARPFLQTYDLTHDRHITRQALTRNNVTDFNKGPEGNKIKVPDVAFLKISHDGQWLATAEEWSPPLSDVDFLSTSSDGEEQRALRREVYLKIWQWDAEKSLWVLETRIDNPHQMAEGSQPGRVLGLVTDPAENGFATIGEDSCVRIWKPKTRLRNGLVVRGSNDQGLVDWSCRHAIQLDHSLPLTEDEATPSDPSRPKTATLAFSGDGSMLAVSQVFDDTAIPPVVHFINTSTGSIEQSRSSLFSGTVKALDFIDRHLILVSDSSIHVWDVVDETLNYRTGLPLDPKAAASSTVLLAVNHQDRTFALSIATPASVSRLRIYNTSSPAPELSQKLSKPVSALLTIPGSKGYIILTTDAQVQKVVPRTTALKASTALKTPTAVTQSDVMDTATTVEDEEDIDMEVDDQDNLLALGDEDEEEADKVVVRPEQLARLFETENVALMPVRAMFDAVVGLYARKPRAAVAA